MTPPDDAVLAELRATLPDMIRLDQAWADNGRRGNAMTACRHRRLLLASIQPAVRRLSAYREHVDMMHALLSVLRERLASGPMGPERQAEIVALLDGVLEPRP